MDDVYMTGVDLCAISRRVLAVGMTVFFAGCSSGTEEYQIDGQWFCVPAQNVAIQSYWWIPDYPEKNEFRFKLPTNLYGVHKDFRPIKNRNGKVVELGGVVSSRNRYLVELSLNSQSFYAKKVQQALEKDAFEPHGAYQVVYTTPNNSSWLVVNNLRTSTIGLIAVCERPDSVSDTEASVVCQRAVQTDEYSFRYRLNYEDIDKVLDYDAIVQSYIISWKCKA